MTLDKTVLKVLSFLTPSNEEETDEAGMDDKEVACADEFVQGGTIGPPCTNSLARATSLSSMPT